MNNIVTEGKYWQLILHEDQTYLGRCILASKANKKSFSEFTTEEASELFEIMKMIEIAMQKAFKATYFNWTALNNDAYKKDNPNKYSFHLHLRPRYEYPIHVENNVFTDPNYGHHYERHTDMHVSDEVMELIKTELQKFFQK